MARKLRVEYAGAIYHLPSLKLRRDKCAESRGSGGNTVSSLDVEPGFGTASSWGNDADVGEISPITGRVPGDEGALLDFGLGTDVKIRQGRGFGAAAAPVF